ncbi:putative tryptophan transport protein [bioreactor metagenome]|uniref:Putative tryptophan transport protein n=1 Tax=bioreactor metagenome TaxID=1076179 RepID=A0A645AYJ8_9ZZZZ
MKMNTKKLVLNAVLLGIGLVLHQIEPAIFGVKPDMTLIMLFTIMIINKDDYKTCLVCGIIAGIFAGMTSSFPGGQVPNVIDKFLTTNISFIIMMAMYKAPFMKKLADRSQDFIVSNILMSIGTAISGFIFLTSAQILVGLPGNMNLSMLFVAVVLPAIGINLIVGAIVFKVIHVTMKRVSFQN